MVNSLQHRVQVIEQELAHLKRQMGVTDQRPWWEQIWGTFANDPAFEEAMRLGREYRESLRPRLKAKSKRKPTHVHSRH
jgi:hypothetical protein